MSKLLLALALVLACALPAAAQQRPPRELTRAETEAIIRPSANEMSRYYPEKATKRNVGGWAVVQCRLGAGVVMRDCRLLGEAPAGYRFGEMSLRLIQLFQVPRTGPGADLLPGDVVTMPIIMSPYVEGGAPPLNYIAGKPSKLLTLAEKPGPGVFACTASRPDLLCETHAFSWDEAPLMSATAALIRSAPAGVERTTLNCGLDADRHLAGCKPGGGDTAQTTAMLELAKLFVAPVEADDKTPMTKGRIIIEFDWPALRATLDASILSSHKAK